VASCFWVALSRSRERSRLARRSAGAPFGRKAVVWLCEPALLLLCTLPAAKVRSWKHRGNTRWSRCVRCVRESVLFGRFGRSCKHLSSVYEVEGLVGRFPRGGSSPLERMRSGWKSMVSRPRAAACAVPTGGPWQRRGNIARTARTLARMSITTAGNEDRPRDSAKAQPSDSSCGPSTSGSAAPQPATAGPAKGPTRRPCQPRGAGRAASVRGH
jgi:hypothetical protein